MSIAKYYEGYAVDLSSLKVLTNDTLKAIRKFDVVTPELFKETFLTKAKEHNISVDLEALAERSMDFTLHKVYEIEEQTVENTQLLQQNIDMATIAIDQQDMNLLEHVQQQMAELNKRISMLEKQVYLDELTKAYNRKWLFEKFLIDEKFTKNGTLIFLDIDKFKQINDTYGHVTGDKVLVMVTQLAKTITDTHTIRYGGDEFIILSPTQNKHDLEHKMHMLSKTLDSKRFKFQGNTFQVHISYGVINFNSGDTFQDVIERVDHKMYTHKRAKNYVLP